MRLATTRKHTTMHQLNNCLTIDIRLTAHVEKTVNGFLVSNKQGHGIIVTQDSPTYECKIWHLINGLASGMDVGDEAHLTVGDGNSSLTSHDYTGVLKLKSVDFLEQSTPDECIKELFWRKNKNRDTNPQLPDYLKDTLARNYWTTKVIEGSSVPPSLVMKAIPIYNDLVRKYGPAVNILNKEYRLLNGKFGYVDGLFNDGEWVKWSVDMNIAPPYFLPDGYTEQEERFKLCRIYRDVLYTKHIDDIWVGEVSFVNAINNSDLRVSSDFVIVQSESSPVLMNIQEFNKASIKVDESFVE